MSIISENNDDSLFINEIDRIVSAVTISHKLSPYCVIKIDNWFDHKWLGHSKHKIPRSWKASKGFIADLGMPGFPKERIIHTKYYKINNQNIELINEENLLLTKCKGCFFFSGNSAANNRGCLMGYIALENDQYWFWFVSFMLSDEWKIAKCKGISVEEIEHYKTSIS